MFNQPYVCSIGEYIFIKGPSNFLNELIALGFVEENDPDCIGNRRYRKPSPDSKKLLADDLSRLRDAGVLFSAGKDWSPSEIVLQLRDDGLFYGGYKEIFWSGPNEWKVNDR